ncbi:MAG: 4-(cytidine 5'-diphospho)-2-C-methyl-D-erythritol kinase [Planctomycetaceae bacterium]
MTSSLPACVVVRAPAKLNLFLELLARRADGFHEIDTVMVPIDRYDTLVVRTAKAEGIKIRTHWWPSRQHWQATLGGAAADRLLQIPDDERNLIHRAIKATAAFVDRPVGMVVDVRKRIPAGAGMGGASSDAASAIRAAAALLGIDAHDDRLWTIAAQIGSDVPFFLGDRAQPASRVAAARATGRGEKLAPLPLGKKLRFIVAYPAESLSTAAVYGQSRVPASPLSGQRMSEALASGNISSIGAAMANRLTQPAIKLSAMVADLLEQMWHCGLPRCQLTGSGAACFSLLDETSDVDDLQRRLRLALDAKKLHAKIFHTETTAIPQPVRLGYRPQPATQ